MIKFDLNDTGLKEYPMVKNGHPILKGIYGIIKNIIKKVLNSKRLQDYALSKVYSECSSERIGDGVYMLKSGSVFNSFLVIGKQRALLIDTGFGIKGLRAMAEEITDKPITVVATHGHFGSIGGAGEFDEVKIHKKDIKLAKLFNKILLRKVLFLMAPVRYTRHMNNDDLINAKPHFVHFTKQELKRGINLGGRTVKIIHCPSHTPGSCCFVDSVSDIVFAGDVVAPLGLNLLPGAQTLMRYYESLEKLLPYMKGKKAYSSYWSYPTSYDRACDFKDLVYETSMYGNDYTKLIRYKNTEDKKQFLIYYPAKTNRRALSVRLKYYNVL